MNNWIIAILITSVLFTLYSWFFEYDFENSANTETFKTVIIRQNDMNDVYDELPDEYTRTNGFYPYNNIFGYTPFIWNNGTRQPKSWWPYYLGLHNWYSDSYGYLW